MSQPADLSFLAASLVALGAAPALLRMFRQARFLHAFLDGFMVVAIAGLVLFEILPHSIALAGAWLAFPMAILGLFGPTILERVRHRAAHGAHALALHLAMAGLLVHGFLDGVGLTAPARADSAQYALPLAILLHRFAEGLIIWRLLAEVRSFRVAIGYLCVLGGTTVAGFFAGDWILPSLESQWIGVFQALVVGALLHVMVHSHDAAAVLPVKTHRFSAGVGALAALLLGFAYLGAGHPHAHIPGEPCLHVGHEQVEATPTPFKHEATGEQGEHDAHIAAAAESTFGERFLALALESAPYLMLGFLLSGLIGAYLPRATFAWLGRGGHLAQSLRGVAFGLPLPVCSCGVLPLFQTLTRAGVPAAAGMSVLVATPELGIDSALLTFRLMGAEFAITRILAAGCVAVAFGYLMGLAARGRPAQVAGSPVQGAEVGGGAQPVMQRAPSGSERFRHALRSGFIEMVDTTGPWILIGLLIAAACEPLLDREWLAHNASLQIPLMAIIGIPLYVCASGATPVMATFVAHGLTPGAALAFLLTGPATNATTFGVISRLYGARLALCAGIAMFALAVAAGYAVDLAAPAVMMPAALSSHSHSGPLALVCLVAFGLLLLASLLRRGPREFIAQVIQNPGAQGPHAPHAGHGHGEQVHAHAPSSAAAAPGGSCCSTKAHVPQAPGVPAEPPVRQ